MVLITQQLKRPFRHLPPNHIAVGEVFEVDRWTDSFASVERDHDVRRLGFVCMLSPRVVSVLSW